MPMYDGPALAAALAAQPPAAPAPAPQHPRRRPNRRPRQRHRRWTATAQAAPAAAPAAATTAAGGTTVVYPPAYPPAYPPPAYSQPYPSFWTPAASFVGGAVVGGMLGYAIGDDNDDFEAALATATAAAQRLGNTVEPQQHGQRNLTRRQPPRQQLADAGGLARAQRRPDRQQFEHARARRAPRSTSGGVAPAASARPRMRAVRTPQRTATTAPRRARRSARTGIQASGAAADRARAARKPGAATGRNAATPAP